MPADKEIFLREYIATGASDSELRELTLDLLDGIGDLKHNYNSKQLEKTLESWTEKAEFELYKEKLQQVERNQVERNQVEINRYEMAIAQTTPAPMAKRPNPRKGFFRIWGILSMALILVVAFIWSFGVGCVVLVAYVFALLMSLVDGKKISS